MTQYNTLTYGDLLALAEKYGFDEDTQIVIQEPFTETVYEFFTASFSHLDGILYFTVPEGTPTVPFRAPRTYASYNSDGES